MVDGGLDDPSGAGLVDPGRGLGVRVRWVGRVWVPGADVEHDVHDPERAGRALRPMAHDPGDSRPPPRAGRCFHRGRRCRSRPDDIPGFAVVACERSGWKSRSVAPTGFPCRRGAGRAGEGILRGLWRGLPPQHPRPVRSLVARTCGRGARGVVEVVRGLVADVVVAKEIIAGDVETARVRACGPWPMTRGWGALTGRPGSGST